MGWAMDAERLKRILPSLVSMNPLSAVCFVLVGAFFVLRSFQDASSHKQPFGWGMRACATLVFISGAAVMVNYLLKGNWGLDQVLFSNKLIPDNPLRPNRMAPNTALNFVMLGGAFLFMQLKSPRGFRFGEVVAVVVVFNSFFALLGYAYKVQFFYSMGSFIPMALHTAFLFFISGVAVLLMKKDQGIMAIVRSDSTGGLLLRGLFPAMVVALSLIGWLRLEGERLGFYGAEVGVTLYTIANISLLGLLILWSARFLYHADIARARVEAERERFFDLSLDLLCVADMTGYFRRVNPAFTTTLGFTAAEILEQPIVQLIHPDDRETTLEAIKKLGTGDFLFQFENRYRRKDGQWRLISWKAQPYLEEGLIYASGRDITEMRISEEALRKAHGELESRVQERTADLAATEAKFRALVEQSLVGIYIIQEGRFVYVNPKMTEIFGYSTEELLAQPANDLIIEEDRALVEGNIQKRLSGEVPHMRYSLRGRHRNGALLHIEVFGSRSNFNGGHAILGSLLDITVQKEAEEALRRLNDELENRVKERTHALESANQELESFSYSVSHDLRAPLRHVHGYVQMLGNETKGQLSAKGERYLKTIGQASVEMGQLIDDLISFSRMGRTELRMTSVDMADLIKRSIAALELESKDRNIQWSLGALPAIRGDEAMLRQVLANLLGNAIKYTRKRNPAIIEIGCNGEEQGQLVFFIKDNGAGFDMVYAEKLFGVFQRMHRAEEFEGTGIGLAIVRRIIKRHGGKVWARAAVNEGATFYFTLSAAPMSLV